MPNALILTDAQIAKGDESLTDDKLSGSQVDDLVSMCRAFLGPLASNYPLETTFESLDDSANTKQRCAKLAACLLLWQEYQFLNGGFAATNANRTGFNFSIDENAFQIFKYAFGFFWDIPIELQNRYLNTTALNRGPKQGNIIRSPY